MQNMAKGQDQIWPELPLEAWADTCQTLQLWTQVVGKIRAALTPWLNHSWHVVLYVTERGLSTSVIPCESGVFCIEFDFVDHVLWIRTSDGAFRQVLLKPQSVALFYSNVMSALTELGIIVRINEMPCELTDPIAFSEDQTHSAYDPEYAQRFWRILLQVHRVFSKFRTAFLGKCSPVHFFWGSFDLAVTRFSGRAAPLLPDSGPLAKVMREAYSHQVSSAGFWPGGGNIDHASFYSYSYPEPKGFRSYGVRPEGTQYNKELGQFLLPYDAVRLAKSPDSMLMEFLQSTYDAAATAGNWDREALECALGVPGKPRRVSSRS
jgi:Family of unknown function (DUF5996)